MNFSIKVSQKNLGSSIHSLTCQVVSGRGPKEGVHTVEAINAEVARANWDEAGDIVSRGLPATKICSCCKSGASS